MSGEAKQKGEGGGGGGGGRKDEIREGDWMCAECSSHNYNARVTCYRCTLPKERSEVMLRGKSALDWDCFQCKASNFSWRHECFKCHITREGSEDMKARQMGVEWFCRFCNLKNFPNRNDCFKCKRNRDFCDSRRRSPPRGMHRGPSPRRSPPRMRRPSPPRRHIMSPPPRRGRSPPRRSRSPHRRRMASPPPRRMLSPPPPAAHTQDEEWRCGLCGTMNGCRRADCYKCTTPKGNPTSSNPGPSLLGQVFGDSNGPSNGPRARNRDGSWDCPDCHIKNYHFRNECFKCKTVKPDELNRSQNNSTALLNHSTSSNKGPSNKSLLSTPISKPDDYYEPESPPKRRGLDSEGLDGSDTGLRQQYGPGRRGQDSNRGQDSDQGLRQQYGPDWACKFCNVDIFPTRNDCYKCGRTRDECDEGIRSGPPLIPDRPGTKEGYTCGCGTFNRCDEETCNWCGKPNTSRPNNRNSGPPPRNQAPPPRNHGNQGPPNADWDCGDCRINNFHYRSNCFKCKKPREQCEEARWAGEGPIERRVSPRPGGRRERTPPRRPLLDRYNALRSSRFSPPPFRGVRGRGSHSPPRRGAFSPPPPPRRGRSPPRRDFRSPPRGKQYQPDWECRECKINNFVKRGKCFRCGKDRSEVEVILNADGKPIGPNDWLCPKCNGHNFSRRDTCYKCKTDRPTTMRNEEDKRESGVDEDFGGDDLDMQGNMDRVEIDAM